jgi:hypothetical protein
MVQFYLLSVLLNVIGGYALTITGKKNRDNFRDSFDAAFSQRNFRLVLGILSLATGVLKLISPMRGDVRIIGDLFPALTGLLVGLCLLAELQKEPESLTVEGNLESPASPEGNVPSTNPVRGRPWHFPFVESMLLANARAVGIIAIIAGIAHFFFPMELFL